MGVVLHFSHITVSWCCCPVSVQTQDLPVLPPNPLTCGRVGGGGGCVMVLSSCCVTIRTIHGALHCIAGGEGSGRLQAYSSGQLFTTGSSQPPQLLPREQVDYKGLVSIQLNCFSL